MIITRIQGCCKTKYTWLQHFWFPVESLQGITRQIGHLYLLKERYIEFHTSLISDTSSTARKCHSTTIKFVQNINSTLVHAHNGFPFQQKKKLSVMEKCQLLTYHRYVGRISSDNTDKHFWNTFNLRNCYIKLITTAVKR